MSLMESIRLAATSLRANRMRFLLTLLGVIIGIASVIGILTIGNALCTQTMEGLESFGASDIPASVVARDDEEEDNPYATTFDTEAYPESLISEDMLEQISQSLGPDLQGYDVNERPDGNAELTDPLALNDASSSVSLEGVNENSLPFAGIPLVAG